MSLRDMKYIGFKYQRENQQNGDICTSSKFGMYCSSCRNIPFWRWLKINQELSSSITCYDNGGKKLYNLQPNKDTDCFSEYLSTLGFESVIKFIAYTLKYRPVLFEEKFDQSKGESEAVNRRIDRKKHKMTNNDM